MILTALRGVRKLLRIKLSQYNHYSALKKMLLAASEKSQVAARPNYPRLTYD